MQVKDSMKLFTKINRTKPEPYYLQKLPDCVRGKFNLLRKVTSKIIFIQYTFTSKVIVVMLAIQVIYSYLKTGHGS